MEMNYLGIVKHGVGRAHPAAVDMRGPLERAGLHHVD